MTDLLSSEAVKKVFSPAALCVLTDERAPFLYLTVFLDTEMPDTGVRRADELLKRAKKEEVYAHLRDLLNQEKGGCDDVNYHVSGRHCVLMCSIIVSKEHLHQTIQRLTELKDIRGIGCNSLDYKGLGDVSKHSMSFRRPNVSIIDGKTPMTDGKKIAVIQYDI